MSPDRTAAGVGRWAGTIGGRAARVWRALPHERRVAALTAAGLFVTLFLPWYQETVIVPGTKGAAAASTSLTGWGAFSFVEAAVLLVAAGVLTLLFQRGEGRAFHLPGGDGWVIMAAGGWACVLVVWRIFDKQSTSIRGPGASISGIEWGIFVALAGAAFLAYAGSRIRAAHQPEPPLPGHDWGFGSSEDQVPGSRAAEAPGSTPPPVRAPSEARSRRSRRATAGGDASPVAVEENAPSAVPRRPASLRQRPTDDRPYFERPPGWLTGAPKPSVRADSPPLPDPDEAPTRHPAEPPPSPDEAPTRHRAEPPSSADEEPSRHVPGRRRKAPLPPATPAARQQSDDQLTIPLEPEE